MAHQNMERLGIADLKKRCYRDLSGGQQQRVLLARALCSAQKLILLDEPVTGLDPIAITEMYSLIKELNQKDGISIIMVSHDIQNLLQHTKHVLHLTDDGAFYGTVDEYLTCCLYAGSIIPTDVSEVYFIGSVSDGVDLPVYGTKYILPCASFFPPSFHHHRP